MPKSRGRNYPILCLASLYKNLNSLILWLYRCIDQSLLMSFFGGCNTDKLSWETNHTSDTSALKLFGYFFLVVWLEIFFLLAIPIRSVSSVVLFCQWSVRKTSIKWSDQCSKEVFLKYKLVDSVLDCYYPFRKAHILLFTRNFQISSKPVF